MKRLVCILLVLIGVVSVFGQSLKDNPDYRESLRYKQLSEQALDDGDYLKAKEYAEQSAEYARKSDEYVAMMLAKYRANQLLQRATGLQGQVERSGRNTEDKEAFSKAVALIKTAGQLYNNGDFTQSSDNSREAINILESTFGGSQAVQPQQQKPKLPAAYLVRDLPGAEDCFWRIAGYDFVYSDPAGWKPLYEANRSKLPEPDNPDLILPGMVMTIPSRPGENRSGVWVDGKILPKAP